jgi:hypothetical protein
MYAINTAKIKTRVIMTVRITFFIVEVFFRKYNKLRAIQKRQLQLKRSWLSLAFLEKSNSFISGNSKWQLPFQNVQTPGFW